MKGIVSYGAYLPYWRLQRSAITAALGSGGGRGSRSVASYDEDTTSMGVEAARAALAGAPGVTPQSLYFATTEPAYLDKTNATAIHAALGLASSVGAYDVIGSVRSSVAAVSAAFGGTAGLAVLSDVRIGLPGGGDEANGGDGAAALLLGEGDAVIAEPIGGASATGEFLDRWRTPGDVSSRLWEERFGEYAYVPLAEEAAAAALKSAGLTGSDIDHLVITGLHARAVKAAARAVGASPDALVDDLTSVIGNTGTAHWGIVLADLLDRAEPGKVICLLNLSDGADCWLLRTTDAIAAWSPATTVRQQIEATRDDLAYAQMLTWRGLLRREPPRRPEPDRPAGPPSLRSTAWKYTLVGSRDEAGFVHLPPSRVSMESGAIDQMTLVRMADVRATVATFTVDRLAFSLSPPVVAAVIDFDGGGRFQCELTDVDPGTVRIGQRVEMTFRRLYTVDGVHDYFWKAKPIRSASPTA